MTSLSRQLETLRTCTAKQLTVERTNASLLFEKKEAAKLDRETVHKIGISGLNELRKLDSIFESSEELFDETNLNIQRTLLSKEENEVLNGKLNRLLLLLSPYMQHFACQQALELLVFRYQIQSYNATALLMAFLPFHETNFFGRIIGILDINFGSSKDWGFMMEFSRQKLPVPFNTLVKNALSSTHSLLTHIASHIEGAIQMVDEEWLESHAPLLFTLYAKLILSILDSNKVNDQILSKIIPMVATGLKSRLPSLRQTALMVICKLAITVKLNEKIISSILKIALLKVKDSSLTTSLSAVVVVCQQQKVESFSSKAILKLLRRDTEIGFWVTLKHIGAQTDLSSFLKALWTTLCVEMTNSDGEVAAQCESGVVASCDLILSGEQATILLDILLQYISTGGTVAKKLSKHVYAVAVRFAAEFDCVRSEWENRDKDVFTRLVEQCALQTLLVQHEKENEKKRSRRRSRSKSVNEEELEENSKLVRKLPSEIASEMVVSSEFAKRKEFNGDPLKKAMQWIKKKQWEELAWALDEIMSRKAYFAKKPKEDIEDFVLDIIKQVVSQTKGLPVAQLRNALVEAPLSADFVLAMITRQDDKGSASKKLKKEVNNGNPLEAFKGESDEEWERRITFSLELLNARDSVPANANIFANLFTIIKQVDPESEKRELFFVQQLAISLLAKMTKNSDSYKVSSKDLQMECVVDAMRSTHSHHVLREALRLLTAAIQLAPGNVTAHVMSVFTFMGSGLLKKDNDLTLGIIEDTLYALFHALVVNVNKKKDGSVDMMRSRLIEVSRIFSTSASDIPAHRRGRMARAIARAIGQENAWIVSGVLFEGFCSKWQRVGSVGATVDNRIKTSVDQDAYEDLALEMCGFFGPVEQLSIVLDVISFVVRLGGDCVRETEKTGFALDAQIFDRTKYTVPKLRHFRFVLIGLAVKIFLNRQLYEKLSVQSNDSLYEAMLPVGKRLLTASVDLDEFVQKETETAEKVLEASQSAEYAQTHRYWVALGARAETVSEKLRHLLPGSVSARLTSLVLDDPSVGYAMREKALALCNTKLLHDGYFTTDSGIHEQQLSHLASILNGWIGPKRLKEEIVLCQNAAFTLKLIAKRLPLDTNSPVLARTMELCTNTAAEWSSLDEAMTGNILLLAGELIRSHNMGTTILSAEPLLKNCIAVLTESSNIHKANLAEQCAREDALNKRARMRQISLSGRPRGSDTLLICALTCMQRILDQFAVFVAPHVGTIIVQYVRMMARFCDPDKEKEVAALQALGLQQGQSAQQQLISKHSIQYRLLAIRSALLRIEFRLMPEHLAYAVLDIRTEEKSLCSLFSLIGAYYNTKNQQWLVRYGKELVNNVYLPSLEFRSIEKRPESFETVSKVEKCIFNSLISMADVLTENQLKPIINMIVNWAEMGLNVKAEHAVRLRVVVLLHFANCFYDVFNSLALPYFGRLIEVCGKVLRMCNTMHITDTSSLLFTGKKNTVEALETDFALIQSLDLIANCAKHRSFFTEERASLVSDALVMELGNTKAAGHEARCVPHLADAIYYVAEGHSQIFSEMLNNILLKTRSNRPKIRYRVLLVCERLFDRIGDAIAPQLPIIMPFLAELLEDENKSVEEQCDRVVRLLQRKFGSDISEGFV